MELKVIRNAFILIILQINLIGKTQAKEILSLLGVGTETALKWNKILINELAAKGHHLTVVTTSIWEHDSKNIDFIHLEYTEKFLKQRYGKDNNDLEQSNWKFIINWYDLQMATCRGNLDSKGLSKIFNLKKTRSFDLIIYDVSYGPGCLLHFAHLFGRIPIVGITSSTLTSEILSINQNSVLNKALDPYTLSDFHNVMNYWKRLYNAALYGLDYAYRQWVLSPVIGLWSHNSLAKNHNIPKYLQQIMPRFKVILANHHPALHTINSLPTNIVSVPGLHIQSNISSNLSVELLSFIENSKTDIILIDLDVKQLKENHVQVILETIEKFPNYRFIWIMDQVKAVTKNKPHNLFIENNLGNMDLLKHSATANKIKFVLTVPEILRFQEFLYHGLPIVTVILKPEQRYLSARIEDQGFGVNLPLSSLCYSSLAKSFEQILSDKNIITNVLQLQKSFRNQQNSPLTTAVWWVENLLENPTANDHLISHNMDQLGYFASNSLDVILFFQVLILICIINVILVSRQTIQNFKKIAKAKRKSSEKTKSEKVGKLKKDKKNK